MINQLLLEFLILSENYGTLDKMCLQNSAPPHK